MIHHFATDHSARSEILIFGARDWFVQKFDNITSLLMSATDERRARRGAMSEWRGLVARNLVPIAQAGLRALMYITVAYHPTYFRMPLSQLNFVETSVRDILDSISSLQRTVSRELVKDLFKIRNLYECIDFDSTYLTPPEPKPYVSHPHGMKIEVKNVSFRYSEGSKDILKDINFTIEPGEIVSIVGYNGSGTLLVRELFDHIQGSLR
jgi:ABC-type multidrug transport system fused ATPase/permease subunit